MLEIADQGVVASSVPNTAHQSRCFPSVCVLHDGTWLCSFRSGPLKTGSAGQPMLTRSTDDGRTWSPPTAPFVAPSLEGTSKVPGVLHSAALTPLADGRLIAVVSWVDCSDPSLPWYNPETEGLLDTRIMLSGSDDGGRTWSKLQWVDIGRFATTPAPLTGPMLVMPDGRWACPFETNKTYEDTGPWKQSAVMTFSADQGGTWPDQVVVLQDPDHRVYYWDHRPRVLPDGTVLVLFWVYDHQSASYRNIHAVRSTDSGRTWSPPWDTGIPGQPGPAAPLPDGRLVMVHVDRTGPCTISACISDDGGLTWPDATWLILYEPTSYADNINSQSDTSEAWAHMDAFAFGLPDTAVTGDGDVLVVHYAGPHADQTDIRWVRLRV